MGYHLRDKAAAGPRAGMRETGKACTGFRSVRSGYRYYSSELGRWVNRDPIEEEGGVHLYAIVDNATIYKIDYLGQRMIEVVESTAPDMVKLVLVERELSRSARRAAERTIRDGLHSVRDVIQNGSATGGLHQFPSGLADRLGQLSRPDDWIELPSAEVVSSALDIYSFLRWANNDAHEQLLRVVIALQALTENRELTLCCEYCAAVGEFAASIPTPISRGIAWVVVTNCYDLCYEHIGFNR